MPTKSLERLSAAADVPGFHAALADARCDPGNHHAALLAACEAGCLPIVQAFMSFDGADAAAALRQAAASGHLPVTVFLSTGWPVDPFDRLPTAEPGTSISAVEAAARNGHRDVVAHLLDYPGLGAGAVALLRAVIADDGPGTCSTAASLSASEAQRWLALAVEVAAGLGSETALEALLKDARVLGLKSLRKHLRSLAWTGSVATLDAALDAFVHDAWPFLSTALSDAAEHGREDTVRYLLTRPPLSGALSSHSVGDAVLQAAGAGHAGVAQLLLGGAPTSASFTRSSAFVDAADLAAAAGHAAVADALLAAARSRSGAAFEVSHAAAAAAEAHARAGQVDRVDALLAAAALQHVEYRLPQTRTRAERFGSTMLTERELVALRALTGYAAAGDAVQAARIMDTGQVRTETETGAWRDDEICALDDELLHGVFHAAVDGGSVAVLRLLMNRLPVFDNLLSVQDLLVFIAGRGHAAAASFLLSHAALAGAAGAAFIAGPVARSVSSSELVLQDAVIAAASTRGEGCLRGCYRSLLYTAAARGDRHMVTWAQDRLCERGWAQEADVQPAWRAAITGVQVRTLAALAAHASAAAVGPRARAELLSHAPGLPDASFAQVLLAGSGAAATEPLPAAVIAAYLNPHVWARRRGVRPATLELLAHPHVLRHWSLPPAAAPHIQPALAQRAWPRRLHAVAAWHCKNPEAASL